MSGARVLLTGAFGNVGTHALGHLVRLGHYVHALDLDTGPNRKRRTELGAGFETHWGDITDAEALGRTFAQVRPEVVIHTAAIIAPLAFLQPQLARAVNVDGTRALIEACSRMDDPPRLVFTSSYTVHGPRNPHRDLPPITGDTPLAPADPYAVHKVECEEMLADSNLPWVIVRLPAVMATDPKWGRHPAFMKFFYCLPPDRREHLIDARDAGLALAHAVEADAIEGKRFAVGGPESDCRVLGIEYHRLAMRALGLTATEERAFRRADPDVDAAWYGEDWVDTTASQAALSYQQHTFADYRDFMRKQAGFSYWPMRALSPLIKAYLHRQSPFIRDPGRIDSTPLYEAVLKALDLA